MAADPVSLDAEPQEHYHVYHAEAEVLSGELKHPIHQRIEKYARIEMITRRDDHFTQTVGETTLEGLISFRSGQTRVSGSRLQDKKDMWGKSHSGWVTLSTSVIEGLNVFDVITADRVVAQVSTEHLASRTCGWPDTRLKSNSILDSATTSQSGTSRLCKIATSSIA